MPPAYTQPYIVKCSILYNNGQNLMHYRMVSEKLVIRFSKRCALALIMVQDIGKKAFKSIVRGHHFM